MNLETLNTLAQFIAAIGVIGSLFYLAAQIRQNTRSMRAVVVDSLAKSRIVALIVPTAVHVSASKPQKVSLWGDSGETHNAMSPK